jgi:hypothetical protein
MANQPMATTPASTEPMTDENAVEDTTAISARPPTHR